MSDQWTVEEWDRLVEAQTLAALATGTFRDLVRDLPRWAQQAADLEAALVAIKARRQGPAE